MPDLVLATGFSLIRDHPWLVFFMQMMRGFSRMKRSERGLAAEQQYISLEGILSIKIEYSLLLTQAVILNGGWLGTRC